MTEQPDSNRPQQNGQPEGTTAKRPRGLGGVLLIMGLMLLLFIMISRSGMEQEKSRYDLYRHLFNGEIVKTNWSDGRVIADIAPADDPRKLERISVVVDQVIEDDRQLIADLKVRTLDERFDRDGGLAEFATLWDSGKLLPTRAYWVSDLPGKNRGQAPSPTDTTPVRPVYNMSVIAVEDGAESWYRLRQDSNANPTVTLQEIRQRLAKADVPIVDRALSRDSKSLVVEKPNTALIYFLGTIGPYILLILLIWFFVIRQMRAPGGSGGVLSFGRSRAALYTKENRTNV
ncbi:MAG: hypothetical protein KDB80_10115, partial [Planctomycetes bacterium]|nr:hypothetical protein [Planctomycetota bacterium]